MRIESVGWNGTDKSERKCVYCNDIEEEKHVLLHFPLYYPVRDETHLLLKMNGLITTNLNYFIHEHLNQKPNIATPKYEIRLRIIANFFPVVLITSFDVYRDKVTLFPTWLPS